MAHHKVTHSSASSINHEPAIDKSSEVDLENHTAHQNPGVTMAAPYREKESGDTLSNDAEKQDTGSHQPEPAGPFDPRSNPDGGLQAWLVVVGCACCLFCSFGWINCMSPFYLTVASPPDPASQA